MNTQNLCAKQAIIAVIVKDNRFYVGSNWVHNPQAECPCKDLPPSRRYEREDGDVCEMCRDICNQHAHAEVDACQKAGEDARGAILYLIGNTYCCRNCIETMHAYGIKEVRYCHNALFLPMTQLYIDQ